MPPKVFVLRNSLILERLIQFLRSLPISETSPLAVKISELTRTLDQNAAQWPILEAIAEQLRWPVNGEMSRLSAEEFKDILTAAFKQERIRLAEGVFGGSVMVGLRTSQMGKREFSEWLDFLKWFCADRGVALDDDRMAA
jgi:hypothetical protein